MRNSDAELHIKNIISDILLRLIYRYNSNGFPLFCGRADIKRANNSDVNLATYCVYANKLCIWTKFNVNWVIWYIRTSIGTVHGWICVYCVFSKTVDCEPLTFPDLLYTYCQYSCGKTLLFIQHTDMMISQAR